MSRNGIFCLEIKAHQGIIFGTEDQEYWIQCKYAGNTQLYNPIYQNYKHTQAIKALLKHHLKAPVYSLVLFTNAQKINVKSDYVFSSRKDIERVISNYTEPVYNADEYADILTLLSAACSKSEEIAPTHVIEVRKFLTANSL